MRCPLIVPSAVEAEKSTATSGKGKRCVPAARSAKRRVVPRAIETPGRLRREAEEPGPRHGAGEVGAPASDQPRGGSKTPARRPGGATVRAFGCVAPSGGRAPGAKDGEKHWLQREAHDGAASAARPSELHPRSRAASRPRSSVPHSSRSSRMSETDAPHGRDEAGRGSCCPAPSG